MTETETTASQWRPTKHNLFQVEDVRTRDQLYQLSEFTRMS